MKSISLLFILLGFNAALYSQQRIYVSQNASGANTGASWADAFTNLHTALTTAQAGDEIWVQAGIYFASNTNDRNVYFQLPSGVALYGGFSGQENNLSAREWQNNPTIFDGNIGNPADSTDNTYNLLLLVTPDSNTIVDGLTFRNAVANKPNLPAGVLGNSGAAIFIDGGETEAFAKIRNCVFEKNTALRRGGAVCTVGYGMSSVAPSIVNCWFLSNLVSAGQGGAIAKIGASWVDNPSDIKDCIFDNNVAPNAGAVFINDSQGIDEFNIVNCDFIGNKMTVFSQYGASVLTLWNPRPGGDLTISFKNCKFIYNLFALFAFESQTFAPSNIKWVIDSSIVEKTQPYNNRIEFSNGGETNGKVEYKISNTSFIDNCLIFSGATFSNFGNKSELSNLYMERSCLIIGRPMNELILNNISYTDSPLACPSYSVRYISANNIKINNFIYNATANTPLLELRCDSLSINNSSFNQNRFSIFSNDGATINNCIFNNSFPVKKDNYPMSQYLKQHVQNCLFTIPDTIQHYNWTAQNNLWSTDPLFINPAAGDFRLQNCSPAINAGDNSVVSPGATDLDGRPRILGGRVDIGAYEHPGIAYAGAPEAQGACAGVYAGRVLFSPQEGCPPYSYAWQRPSDGSSGTRLDSLLPGEYLFSITDSRGQVLLDTVLLPESIPPSVATVSAPAQCGSNGGSISVQPSGGTPPFVYNWADAPGQDTPLRFNLAPGEYRYTLSDGAGCRDSALLNIAVQGLLPLSSSVTPVSCFGGSDGTLTVAALGAVAPVQYSWEPGGASTPSLTGLAAGLYSLNVSDAWGCTTSMMFEVDEPDSLQFEGLVQDATNLAPMGGSILLDPITGGTPPYNLAWDNGSTANPLQNLAPGEYRVSLRDSKNCLSEWTFMVDLITSSGEPQAGSGLFLYPNPARSLVWIQGDLAPGTLLQVFDIQGRMVKELIYQPGQGLEVGDLAAGTYQVRNAECGMRNGVSPSLAGRAGEGGRLVIVR